MKEDGFGKMFLRHLVMAIPWGVIFLLVFFIATLSIKQEIKEGIDFAIKSAISETARFAFDDHVAGAVKQNIKEGMEFAAKTAKNELENLLNDPQVKKDLKEIFEYRPERYRE